MNLRNRSFRFSPPFGRPSIFAGLLAGALAIAFAISSLAFILVAANGTVAVAQNPFAGSAFEGGTTKRPTRPVVPSRPQYNPQAAPQYPQQVPAARQQNYPQNVRQNPNNSYPAANAAATAPASTAGRGRYSNLPERRDPYASRSPATSAGVSAPAVPSTYSPSAPLHSGQRPINLPDGDELLRQVQSRLPRDHLIFPGTIRGTTIAGKRVSVPVEIDLNWAATQPTATYTLLDERGLPSLAMRVVWVPNQEPIIEYRSGSSLSLVPNVRITDKILDLELTWSDLALSFIWWRNGRTLGGGIKKLNRRCFLVEVPAPHWESRLYNKAQLWIDDNERMVVQGQTFTAAGRPLRYFEVDEIAQWKKDHWMAKKLEFASIDSNNRKRHKVYIDIDVKNARQGR